MTAVVKRRPGAPPGFFRSEASGLAWLAETGTVAVPEVLAVDAGSITLVGVTEGPATAGGAERLGRALADLHAAGAPAFGAPWPGFIGPLAMDNSPDATWADFFARRRVLPFLRAAVDGGALDRRGAASVERALGRLAGLPGAGEPPARLHGDLWSGNVLWDGAGEAWVIDPAAHGGHRETDLAMLALFGAPYLDRILDAYDEHRPLAAGWRLRAGIHQIHPLLVHAVLFGGTYGARAAALADRV
ncbi:MAG: fructosamine kinase family protein [Acidimicrobiales bacterium]